MRKFFTCTILSVVVVMFGQLFADGLHRSYPALPEQSAAKAEPEKTQPKRKIDLKWDEAGPLTPGDSAIFLVGNFAAQHNGAVITCDSAVRYSDRHFEFFGNVLINQNTTYIYGDRAEYDGDKNEARIYSDLVKVVDGDATLYTYKFVYNTLDNIGEYDYGGVMINRDNRLESQRGYYMGDTKELIAVKNVEMRNADYDLTGDSVVYNMETDNAYFFRNTRIWSDKGDYLYADEGEYQQVDSVYIITRNGFLMTEKQEMWSDSINYYSQKEHAILRHNIQIDDTERKALAFGDYGEYWKHPGNILLTRNPSTISYDLKQSSDTVFMSSDTIFLQTIYYAEEEAAAVADSTAKAEAAAAEQKRRADSVAAAAKTKIDNKDTDRQKDRKSESIDMPAMNTDGSVEMPEQKAADTTQQMPKNDSLGSELPDSLQADSLPTDSLRTDSPAPDSLRADSLAADTLTAKQKKARLKAELKEKLAKERAERRKLKDSLRRQRLDTIMAQRKAKNKILLDKEKAREERIIAKRRKRVAEKLRKKREKALRKGRLFQLVDPEQLRLCDSLRAIYEREYTDSMVMRMFDSLLHEGAFARDTTDSLASDTLAKDSLYRLIKGYRNVKIFRSDFQAVCDSTVTSSTDSIIRLFISPVLWNGQNQITSQQMDIHTERQQLVRAEFTGDPLSASELDTVHYNQIKGKTMTSFFRNNEIYRNDFNGNVQTIYYMQDGEPPVVTAMAAIESGDASFFIEQKQVVRIVYRTNPVFPIYPIDQIPETQKLYLDGFKWESNRRPTRDSIQTRPIRPSMRRFHSHQQRPSFPILDRVEKDKIRYNEERGWIDRNDHVDPITTEWMHELGFEVGQPRKEKPKF